LSNDFEKSYRGWHQKISLIKSGLRIAASISCIIALILASSTTAILILSLGYGLAEILGIAEEWM
jgi:hypothetical protein